MRLTGIRAGHVELDDQRCAQREYKMLLVLRVGPGEDLLAISIRIEARGARDGAIAGRKIGR